MDTRAEHVQHGLADVGRERLADALPHLVSVAIALFEQVVVVKADGANAHALDLNEERLVLAVIYDAVGVTKDVVLLVADGHLSVLGVGRATGRALVR